MALRQFGMLSPCSQEILFGFGDMVNTLGVTAKVLQFLDRKPKQKEAGELAPAKLEGRLDFHNVTLFYPSRPDKPVLKVSIQIKQHDITNRSMRKTSWYRYHFQYFINEINSIKKGYTFSVSSAGIMFDFLTYLIVCDPGAASREDDSAGGALWRWKDFLLQSAGALLRATGGPGPARWTAPTLLPASIPARKSMLGTAQLSTFIYYVKSSTSFICVNSALSVSTHILFFKHVHCSKYVADNWSLFRR